MKIIEIGDIPCRGGSVRFKLPTLDDANLIQEAELPPKVGRASTDGQGNSVSVIDSVYIDSDGNLVVVYNE